MFGTYAWPHRWSFVAGGVCLLLTNWLTVSIPVELGVGIDALTEGGDVGAAAWNIGWMGVAVIFVRTLSRVLFFNPGRDIEYRLRCDLFTHLLMLQPSFYAHHRTGDIVSRASNDITWTRAMVGFGLLQLVNTSLAVTLTGWKMISISLSLTVVTLVPVLLSLALLQIYIKKLFHLQKRSQEQLGVISDHVLGSFQSIATIQGFVAEPAFIDRLENKNQAWLDTNMRLAVIRSLAFPMLALAGGASVFALLYIGGPMALEGDITVGELAAFAALLAALLPPLRSLGWMLSVLQRGQAALERIFELMDAPVERPEGDSPVAMTPGSGPRIEVRSLDFAYPDQPDRQVLHDVNLDLPAGKVVGVFGRTGSGKSTLLRLLSRLYDPPTGTVMVDGVDIARLERSAWRKRLAVAPQRPFLFSDTIAHNVSLGMDPGPGEVEDAVNRASLTADLRVLPDGLDTVVGQRGIMLSGGQRQRVALARALIRDGDLIMLDDVLSAVDHATEQRLVKTLRSTGADREHPPTVVIVSHRLSALQHADSIVVLDKGRVIDQGSHMELIARPGPYRDTWQIQQGGDP